MGASEAASGAGRASGASVERLVRAEQVRGLFARNGVAQGTVFLNSAVVVAVLWGQAPSARLLLWAGAIWLVAAARLGMGVAFGRAAPPPGEVGRWARWYTAGAAVNGVAWGLAPLLVVDGLPVAYVAFLAFVLGGMAAGGALSNASHQPAFLAFTVPALVPMIAVLLARGDRLSLGMGVLLLSFGLAVTAISRAGGRAQAEAARLRFANAELAGGLAELNEALERRVEERTAELAASRAREREAEQELRESVRLAMLGSLAAGVAHEVNNPLTAIKSNLGFAREELARLGEDAAVVGPVREALDDAGAGVERVARIVRRLLALSRAEAPEPAHPTDLVPVLDRCLEMARAEVEGRARLVRDFEPVPRVVADGVRLVQVMLNLLRNAAQAIPEGAPDRHEVRVRARPEPGGEWVAVEVVDTGSGIAAADLERIWDPFFTTRPLDQGIGLGLDTARSLVARLGGTIGVSSEEGKGSTFTVRLRVAGG